MIRTCIRILAVGGGLGAAAFFGAAHTTAAGAVQRPNIVFILADDLGWRDLGSYGSEWHRTPNLDRLAREGMRFTQAYSPAPICSAARAAILTGKSPARLNFEFVTKQQPGAQAWTTPLQSPPYTLDLPLAERTVAEVLRDAGYSTGFFGKWHVSRHHGSYLKWSPTHGPLQQGFEAGDEEFGSHTYSYPKDEDVGFGDFKAGEFPRDALTDKAIAYLREKREQRFFLYLSHYYVHSPIHTRMRWLFDHYRTKLPEERAAYAAMVETLDHEVGRLLAALDELGLAKNTLVVFASDNGGHPEYAANGPLRGSKWNLYEGGVRVPFIVRWPGRVAASKVNDGVIMTNDLYATFAAAGGGSTGASGEIDSVSLLPALEAKATAAADRALVWHFPYYHPEGEKLFPAAKRDIGVNDFAVSQTRPHSAIRVGDYKLLRFYEDDREELYDVTKDMGEQRNLATEMPAKRKELRERLDAYLRGVNARLPTPGEPHAAKSKTKVP
jgi:arylsulfatase A-like enzyme